MEFPYAYRRSQQDVVNAMTEAVHGQHIVLEAGTGIGKTVCALFAAGSEALAGDKSVLYLVRTNSQQRQVIMEARKLGLKTAALQGRHNLCPLLHAEGEFRNATSEELSRACQDRKARTLRGEQGCKYYHKLTFGDSEGLRQWALQETPTAEEVRTRCETAGVCPYEFTKSLLPQVKVVTAPYIYFFDPRLRHALLRWMAVPPEDIVLVVDEAVRQHFGEDFEQDLRSVSVPLFEIETDAPYLQGASAYASLRPATAYLVR